VFEDTVFWRWVIEMKYWSSSQLWRTCEVRRLLVVVLWMHIRSGWTQFERFIRFDAGNGTQTRFWLDVWQGKTTLRLPLRGDIPLCFTLQEIEMLEWPIM